jgi:FkbM family methyltransferase
MKASPHIASVLRYLNKPYYAFRPSQLLRRAKWSVTSRRDGHVLLPWGLPIRVRTNEAIGRAIAQTGLYDLCTTEALFRLTDLGEVAIDAGANIGYLTSVLAVSVGRNGRVEAFEPHPAVFSELSDNVARWRDAPISEINLHQLALSDRAGAGILRVTDEFSTNRGIAALDIERREGGIDVPLARLDELVHEQVGLMKLDVEGHELAVLNGSEALLGEGKIRDIVFEQHGDVRTDLTRLVESYGFTLFSIDQGFLGPWVHPPPSAGSSWEPPTYLATRDPVRALRRLRPRGWSCLTMRRLGAGPA